MTTTSLYIDNMRGDYSLQTIKELLYQSGFTALSISIGKVKISRKPLTHNDIIKIRQRLKNKGYKLLSVCETTWPDRF